MVYGYNQVLTAQHEIASLVECIDNSQSLAFNRGITRFRAVCESAADQDDLPSRAAAVEFNFWTITVLLEECKSDSCFAPIRSKASWSAWHPI